MATSDAARIYTPLYARARELGAIRMRSKLTEERAAETGLLTLGSSFALSSGVVVKGDVAIADEEDGEGTTAGRVSLRLNF